MAAGWNRGTAKIYFRKCFGCDNDIELSKHGFDRNKTGLWSCNSRECKKAIQSELARIRWSNPEFKNKFVPYLKGTKQYLDKTCSHCRKQFKFEKYLLKRHISQRFYCSTSCSYADRNGHTNSNFGKKHPGINAGPRPKIMGRNNPMFGKITVRSCGYRKDLGHICRSSWEANYCRILKYLGVDYEYEPLTFEMTDTSYTPDIRTGNTFIEIKGYHKISFVLKHSNFTRLYPKINLVIINEKIYSHLAIYYSRFIKNWEPDCFIK